MFTIIVLQRIIDCMDISVCIYPRDTSVHVRFAYTYLCTVVTVRRVAFGRSIVVFRDKRYGGAVVGVCCHSQKIATGEPLMPRCCYPYACCQ